MHVPRFRLVVAMSAVAVLLMSACTAAPTVSPTHSASHTRGATASPTPLHEKSATPTLVPPTPSPTTHAPTTPPPPPSPDSVAALYAGHTPTQWGMDVTGVHTSLTSSSIALTFDACGGPHGSGYDKELIDGLIARNIPATLFLNSRWIEANPDIAKELASNPLFELGNHGTEHRPLSVKGQSAYGIPGTASALEAANEVWGDHIRLTQLTGKPPRFFRSGTAHYDEIATSIVEQFGEKVVGFTVNADGGATFDAATVRNQVDNAPAGAIIIAHMNQPAGETAEGILPGIDDLVARGVTFTHLDDLK